MPDLLNDLFRIVPLLLLLAIYAFALRFFAVDAMRRGKSPFLVSLVAVFFFPLGTIAWLLFRPEVTGPSGPPRAFHLEDHRTQ